MLKEILKEQEFPHQEPSLSNRGTVLERGITIEEALERLSTYPAFCGEYYSNLQTSLEKSSIEGVDCESLTNLFTTMVEEENETRESIERVIDSISKEGLEGSFKPVIKRPTITR